MALSLGIIPSYQFSSNPAENPYLINPHLKMPPGMTQTTVQPVGPYVTSGDANLQGFGRSRWRSNGYASVCAPGCAPLSTGGCDCPYITQPIAGVGITMVDRLAPAASGAGISGVFDSWWWRNRKWLAVGLISLFGIGVAALATKVLR